MLTTCPREARSSAWSLSYTMLGMGDRGHRAVSGNRACSSVQDTAPHHGPRHIQKRRKSARDGLGA